MDAVRIAQLATAAIVLAAAAWAAQHKLGMGIAVAIFGLTLTYVAGVLAVPAAVGLAVAAVYVPGVIAVGAMCLVVYLYVGIFDNSPTVRAYRWFNGGP